MNFFSLFRSLLKHHLLRQAFLTNPYKVATLRHPPLLSVPLPSVIFVIYIVTVCCFLVCLFLDFLICFYTPSLPTHCEIPKNRLLSVLSIHHDPQSLEQSAQYTCVCWGRKEGRGLFCYLCPIRAPSLRLLPKPLVTRAALYWAFL